MSHDYDAQRAETRATYAELQAAHGLPEFADVDYFLVPAAKSDWQPLAKALADEGYDCEWVEDDGEANGPYLVATLFEQIISADGIWLGEEVATRIALSHGFEPDGWGLLGDGED
ncbi:ribonuclease E inhibitor RraB [Sagittula sp. SSi028]|uniref:ribonuclease E inhibitor RraB n=1 Tax=Sagittula sp. SSi028 TaxID=3400636 RepID=UPI003AF85094